MQEQYNNLLLLNLKCIGLFVARTNCTVIRRLFALLKTIMVLRKYVAYSSCSDDYFVGILEMGPDSRTSLEFLLPFDRNFELV